MSTESYCRNCGTSLDAEVVYCPVCGTSTSSGYTVSEQTVASLNTDVMPQRTGAIAIRMLISGIGFTGLLSLIGPILFIVDLILMRNGQDWTAKVFHLRVVRTNGDIAGLAHMVTRTTVSILSLFIFGLGFITAYFDDNKQTWHDKIMGTYVVKDDPGLADRGISSSKGAKIWGYFLLGGLFVFAFIYFNHFIYNLG
jgi:uncharacterized RDD family membrane protein YckC